MEQLVIDVPKNLVQGIDWEMVEVDDRDRSWLISAMGLVEADSQLCKVVNFYQEGDGTICVAMRLSGQLVYEESLADLIYRRGIISTQVYGEERDVWTATFNSYRTGSDLGKFSAGFSQRYHDYELRNFLRLICERYSDESVVSNDQILARIVNDQARVDLDLEGGDWPELLYGFKSVKNFDVHRGKVTLAIAGCERKVDLSRIVFWSGLFKAAAKLPFDDRLEFIDSEIANSLMGSVEAEAGNQEVTYQDVELFMQRLDYELLDCLAKLESRMQLDSEFEAQVFKIIGLIVTCAYVIVVSVLVRGYREKCDDLAVDNVGRMFLSEVEGDEFYRYYLTADYGLDLDQGVRTYICNVSTDRLAFAGEMYCNSPLEDDLDLSWWGGYGLSLSGGKFICSATELWPAQGVCVSGFTHVLVCMDAEIDSSKKVCD